MALPGLLHCVAMDPAEHRIFLGLESGDIAQASLVEASPSASELPGNLPALKGHLGPVQCLAVTPDGTMLASGRVICQSWVKHRGDIGGHGNRRVAGTEGLLQQAAWFSWVCPGACKWECLS